VKLLFDGDLLAYMMSAACQQVSPFNKDLIVKACPMETWGVIEMRIKQCVDLAWAHFGVKPQIVMCISPGGNSTFRYDLMPDYKANRVGKARPILLGDMLKKLEKEYPTEIWPKLEADDVMGILADGENTCIVTNDKDLRQVSTYHMKLTAPEFVDWVDEEDGYKFFLKQVIAGDATDGYYGCPGLGMKKAEKLLETKGYTWTTVVEAYESAMSPKSENGVKIESYSLELTEEDALLTARMAWILKEEEEYERDELRINYWNPTDRPSGS